MIRGTTPTHIFSLPFDVGILSAAKIAYAQNGDVKFTKDLTMCETNGNDISVKLTQEDTLQLNDLPVVEIQIRAKTLSGDVFASKIIKVPICKCLEAEVI